MAEQRYQAVLAVISDTREQAVDAGREEAKERRTEHIIRRLDGTIGDRHTYGHDPRDIPG